MYQQLFLLPVPSLDLSFSSYGFCLALMALAIKQSLYTMLGHSVTEVSRHSHIILPESLDDIHVPHLRVAS